MVIVNEYFNGKVKSLNINLLAGKRTVGVVEAGTYEFSTGTKEIMFVISGAMDVKLPGSNEWKLFKAGENFEVPASSKFSLRVSADAAYLCEYA